jgi:ElaA protein
MNWQLKKFEDLSNSELYAILRLRSDVFVVEQNCVYLDLDNSDQQCYHFFLEDDGKIIAYTRLVPPGLHYKECSIGRVVTHPDFRKNNYGKQLVQKSIEQCVMLFPNHSIKIGAQLYLKKFYETFGFTQNSEIYLEDGIEHIKMILNRRNT